MTMTCKQKLCNRSKNISHSGNCNVCEDVVNNIMKKQNETSKKKTNFERVDLDLKMMIETHRKLVSGTPVDSTAVNVLLLGGIVNILNQSESVDDVDERTKALGHENVSNKARIEALENWVLSQNDTIVKLSEKLPNGDENREALATESNELKILGDKIKNLDTDVRSLKKSLTPPKKDNLKVVKVNHPSTKCKFCDAKFYQNCQLEKHVVDEHQKEKEHSCEVCGKKFFLLWRLKKHKHIHDEVHNFCHYFNNEKVCPFKEIGCKFVHKFSGMCKFEICTNQLCQYQHGEKNSEVHNDEDLMEMSENDGEEIEENQCHLCMEKFPCNDSLFEHFENTHKQFYAEIMMLRKNMLSS